MHPLTVKEICGFLDETPKQALDALIRFGGFPEPYLRKNETYTKRWRRTLVNTVIRDDNFSESLYRFQGYLSGTRAVQVVYDLRQAKSVPGKPIAMAPAHEFLENFTLL